MYLNTTPPQPARKPCWRDMARLTTGETALLPAFLVQSMSLKQLRRRVREIDATHPQYREETPLVVQHEERRRQRFQGKLVVATSHAQVA